MSNLEVQQLKLPPQNLEAELSILGGILLDNESMHRVIEILSPADFYRDAHRKIFQAVIDLYQKNEPVDLVTLTTELRSKGQLEETGGATYLSTLVDKVPSAANVASYARMISEKSVLRRLIEGATDIAERAYRGEGNVEELVDSAEKVIFDVAERRMKKNFVSAKELVKDTFKSIEQLYERKELITGVPTGFHELDKITCGFQRSDLIVIAGRPSMGKTALVLNIVERAAIDHGITGCIFSLEMSQDQLMRRILCSRAEVDASKLRGGFLSESDWPKLTRAAGLISEAAPIFIDDSPAINVLEVRAKTRRLQREHEIGLVVVDYLQLMRGVGRFESREREISEISRSLKALAKELNVPVIALSQLNRGVESRQDKRPQLADLRECVSGDTRVILADGKRVPIRDIVGQTPRVFAMSDDCQIVSANSEKIWCVGKKPVLNLKLTGGRSIRVTGKHRLYSGGGWKRVQDMSVRERVAIARKIPEPDQCKNWSDKRIDFSPSRETVLNYAQPLGDRGLYESATNDLFWDRIISIEDGGEEEVYDLTVPGPESWLADGIISHNSGAIEQDADVIAFIYRDEMYNPESADVGKAEIIIGKQRNGPTGRVVLAFRSNLTRFDNLAHGVDGFAMPPSAEAEGADEMQ